MTGSVRANQVDGNLVIVEITASREDLIDFALKERAIQAIGTRAGLGKGRFGFSLSMMNVLKPGSFLGRKAPFKTQSDT